MKTKMKRNAMLASLLVGCASCALVGGMFANGMTTVSANNTNFAVDVPETFTTLAGAQVRKTSDTSGIRFSAIVNKDYKDTTLAGKDVEFGMLVIKASDLGDNTLDATTAKAKKIPADVILSVDENGDDNTDYYRYNVALTNIPETDYETELVARAYATVDGETLYGDADNVQQKRSIALVASRAYAANEADDNNVIVGYVNAVAQAVSFGADTQKLNKAAIADDTIGLTATTNPTGYAVRLSSDNEEVAKIVNGKIVPQAKEGKAKITAQFGSEKTAEYTLSVVSYSATLGGTSIADDALVKVKVADGYFAALDAATVGSTADEALVITEYDGANTTDVTADAAIEYSLENVALVSNGTIQGGTLNGTTSVSAKMDGWEVANFDVEGWTEITTKKQMDELSLVTWRERNNADKVKQVLNGNYILGADIAYNGDYILPIANRTLDTHTNPYQYASRASYTSWVWEEILQPITPEWESIHFNSANNTFSGSNPLNLPFTGTFNGNGHKITDAQILDVNILYGNYTSSSATAWTEVYAGGGCVFGTNNGTIKNINFDGLRYRKYYALDADTDMRDKKLTDEKYQVYLGNGSKMVPYVNNVAMTNDSGFIRENQGTVSDILISTYLHDLNSTGSYGEGDHKADSLRPTYGVQHNTATGVVKNFVLNFKSGTIDYLLYDESVEDRQAGCDDVLTNILYTYNEGVMSDCVCWALTHNSTYKWGSNTCTNSVLRMRHTAAAECTDPTDTSKEYPDCTDATKMARIFRLEPHNNLSTITDGATSIATFNMDVWDTTTMKAMKVGSGI